MRNSKKSSHKPTISRYLAPIFALLLAFQSVPALAQSVARPSSPQAQGKAADFCRDGKAAFEADDPEKARELLVQAFALNPTVECAADLGLAEFVLQRYRDAAEHCGFVVNHPNPNEIPSDTLSRCLELFHEAAANIATLTLELNEPGAEVFVDGKSMGHFHATSTIYAEPGKHVISAKKNGFVEAGSEINAQKNSHTTLKLKLLPASSSAENAKKAPAGSLSIVGLRHWTLALIGVGLTSGAFVFGLGYSINAQLSASKVIAIDNAVQALKRRCDEPYPPDICQDRPMFQDEQDSYGKIALGGFIATGIFALATGILFLIPPSSSAAEKKAVSLQFAPILTHQYQGAQVQIAF